MTSWPLLASLRADLQFAWRRLRKNPVTSAAAVLSLALAMGACAAAFRIIDALLLRPLPVAGAHELHFLNRHGFGFDGKANAYTEFEYPLIGRMQAAVAGRAEVFAVSAAERIDLTYAGDDQMEKAYRQYVSGAAFASFGLRPARGRLLSAADDRTPGGHPYAVLSHDYWTRRFGADPSIVGRPVRIGTTLFEIVGVTEAAFTGTETGRVTDVFLPAMMHAGVGRDDWTWTRAWVRIPAGTAREPVQAQLNATLRAFLQYRADGFTNLPPERKATFVRETLTVESAAAGVSLLQEHHRRAFIALAVLVGLVLLIACANVANLMTAQGAARAREMAVRLSIGARRSRLVQLVLVEGGCIAVAAAASGALFAAWAAPFVVSRINPPDDPARLALAADWRVLAFGLALTTIVIGLFGVLPALRASAVTPMLVLRGGAATSARRRGMQALIAAQVAFCVLVLFVSALFIATFDRLSHLSTGFSADRLLTVETVAARAESPIAWEQMADRLRALPGVEQVAIAGWTLLEGSGWNNFASIDGAPSNGVLAFQLAVSPDWRDTMKIPLLGGRDFTAQDTQPGAVLVNETFARTFLRGQDPVGHTVAIGSGDAARSSRIVGVVRDTYYRELRETILPIAFVPFHALDRQHAPRSVRQATFLVKTRNADPMSAASLVREEIRAAGLGFRASTVRTQTSFIEAQTVRERLLAMLASFFALVALVLAGVGLHGVLHYSVLQRRREIGIRMALGARTSSVAAGVTRDTLLMVAAGIVSGTGAGLAAARSIETLFFQVRATDLTMLVSPSLVMLAVALLASLPAVWQAVRVNPVTILRGE